MSQDQTQNNQNPEEIESVEEVLENITGDDGVSTNPKDDILSEITRLQEALARSQADYQNLVMRNERDKADMVHFLSTKILLPLLTQVDNLERAVKLKDGIEWDAFVDGVRSVFSGFQKYLESQKVTAFESLGQEVNPDRHDVMTEMPGESGKIISEFEKGYLIGDRVLRHAKVVTGNGE